MNAASLLLTHTLTRCHLPGLSLGEQGEQPTFPSALMQPHQPSPETASHRVINRLVLVPHDIDERLLPVRKEQLAHLALELGEGEDAYVYVALRGQRVAEDNEAGVRFLPLSSDHLPCFGNVESVVVFNDKAMASAAASAYPMAAIFHLEPTVELVAEPEPAELLAA